MSEIDSRYSKKKVKSLSLFLQKLPLFIRKSTKKSKTNDMKISFSAQLARQCVLIEKLE